MIFAPSSSSMMMMMSSVLLRVTNTKTKSTDNNMPFVVFCGGKLLKRERHTHTHKKKEGDIFCVDDRHQYSNDSRKANTNNASILREETKTTRFFFQKL